MASKILDELAAVHSQHARAGSMLGRHEDTVGTHGQRRHIDDADRDRHTLDDL